LAVVVIVKSVIVSPPAAIEPDAGAKQVPSTVEHGEQFAGVLVAVGMTTAE